MSNGTHPTGQTRAQMSLMAQFTKQMAGNNSHSGPYISTKEVNNTNALQAHIAAL